MTTTCPSCGGVYRTAIAPGYWECTTQTFKGLVMGANGVPIFVPGITEVCRERYQDGSPLPAPEFGLPEVCAICGTFSLGPCGECGTERCGDHADCQRWHSRR